MFKKILSINFLLLVSFIFCTTTKAQELPSLKEVHVKAYVTLNEGIFSYSYIVSSEQANTGELYSLDIDITSPQDSVKLSSENLTIPSGKSSRSFEQSLSPFTKVAMVPVGMEKPKGWITVINENGSAGWGAGDNFTIKRGEQLDGFKFVSYGLPGMRNLIAEPWIDVNEFYPNVDELESMEEVDALMAKIKQDKENAVSKGKTIGPTAPPDAFEPVDFLSSIINMKHEAYKLGWIKNEGILKSLDAKLENAKKDIEKGNTRSAKNTLKAFINEVEAQGCESYENCPSGKHLTSEAYGLLKYNAQYLIDRL